MALAITRMIVVIPLFTQDIPIAIGVMPSFAFLADVLGAAHKGDI
jgi:hypothetical protein